SSHELFFLQAEDGIRDFHVTGVQTCALPIYQATSARSGREQSRTVVRSRPEKPANFPAGSRGCGLIVSSYPAARTPSTSLRRIRSEERRVGIERRYSRSTHQE